MTDKPTITLINDDCLNYMKSMPDKSVAIITDPPFGVNYKHGEFYGGKWQKGERKTTLIEGDNMPFDPLPFLRYTNVVLFGANNFSSRLPDSRGWIVWDKRPEMKEASQGDCVLIWTNKNVSIRRFEYMWNGLQRDGELNEIHFHPTQKPVALMKWIIENYSEPTDTIFDPFMGSGTTGVACKLLRRNFIGCEIDKKYFDLAKRRIDSTEWGLF